jgi:hypothetical protein
MEKKIFSMVERGYLLFLLRPPFMAIEIDIVPFIFFIVVYIMTLSLHVIW